MQCPASVGCLSLVCVELYQYTRRKAIASLNPTPVLLYTTMWNTTACPVYVMVSNMLAYQLVSVVMNGREFQALAFTTLPKINVDRLIIAHTHVVLKSIIFYSTRFSQNITSLILWRMPFPTVHRPRKDLFAKRKIITRSLQFMCIIIV